MAREDCGDVKLASTTCCGGGLGIIAADAPVNAGFATDEIPEPTPGPGVLTGGTDVRTARSGCCGVSIEIEEPAGRDGATLDPVDGAPPGDVELAGGGVETATSMDGRSPRMAVEVPVAPFGATAILEPTVVPAPVTCVGGSVIKSVCSVSLRIGPSTATLEPVAVGMEGGGSVSTTVGGGCVMVVLVPVLLKDGCG